jgi:hypothetical protein
MRHVVDLIVGVALFMVLAAAVYFTPRLADYMSTEGQESQATSFSHGLAYYPSNATEAPQ